MSAEESIMDKLDQFMAEKGCPATSSTWAGGRSSTVYYGNNLLKESVIKEAFEILDGVEEAQEAIDEAAKAPEGGNRMDSAMGQAYKNALKQYAKGKIDENPGASLDAYVTKQKEKLKERPHAMANLVHSMAVMVMGYHLENQRHD
tara:strand:- start:81 stop:518 length:438 start_codon:yes stop_codon:yes gene_type:complete